MPVNRFTAESYKTESNFEAITPMNFDMLLYKRL